jgi:hypothetical protein
MILPADAHFAFSRFVALAKPCGDIAALQLERIDDQRIVGGFSASNVMTMRQVAVFDLDPDGSVPSLLARFGNDGKDRLAVELDLAVAKTGSSCVCGRAHIIFARDIVGREDADHAGADDRLEINRDDLRMGALRQAEIGVQGASGFRHIVDIFGGSRHMLVAGFVALFVDAAA